MASRDQQIRVNALLLEREELFLRVHTLEGAVADIFGEGYPFTRPALPSDAPRGKRKPASRRAAATTASTRPAPPNLRRLEEHEVGYRVTYRQYGRSITEDHCDADALRTLLAAQGETVQVIRVETLDTDGTPAATLFELS